MKVKYTDAAQADIDNIFVYLALNAEIRIADRMIDRIVEVCSLLQDNPRLGTLREELSETVEIRSVPIEEYIALYTILDETVWILRVPRCSQDYLAFHFEKP